MSVAHLLHISGKYLQRNLSTFLVSSSTSPALIPLTLLLCPSACKVVKHKLNSSVMGSLQLSLLQFGTWGVATVAHGDGKLKSGVSPSSVYQGALERL